MQYCGPTIFGGESMTVKGTTTTPSPIHPPPAHYTLSRYGCVRLSRACRACNWGVADVEWGLSQCGSVKTDMTVR